MAHAVTWLPEAVADLSEIAEYISGGSPAYASAVVRRALHTAARLADFPRMGPMVPEWEDPTLRQCLIFNYRMIYRLRASAVDILAVIHGARMLPNEIKRR